MRLLGVLLVLVGCHGAGSVAPDASTKPDVPPQAQGLTVTWRARPNVPGMITDKITVTDAVFQLQHLQPFVCDTGFTRFERDARDAASPLLSCLPPGMVHEHIAHRDRGDGHEVGLAAPFPAPVGHPQISLVHQRGRLDADPDLLP